MKAFVSLAKVKFGCAFSTKYPGLFKCTEVTSDGFRGKATLESKIKIDEIHGESIEVFLNTPFLTYNGTFGLEDCKVQ